MTCISSAKTIMLSGILSLLIFNQLSVAQETDLYRAGIRLIPYPREAKFQGADFFPGQQVTITLDKNASESDLFAASELRGFLEKELGVKSTIQRYPAKEKNIVLTRKGAKTISDLQGYELTADGSSVTIRAKGEAGLFYGVQTICQLFQKKDDRPYIKGIHIRDSPDTRYRASHYDTKHHQDKKEYVEGFIRDLARYKINMLVWEWEDKFAYPSHPEIGAPGAFTMQEMQEFTRYAKKFHIQIVPLVQGLGHVSFILKWPQHAHLREVAASNFEFCPLKDGSYKLLSELWDDAIKATPGSQFIHIGSDETYELGMCALCAEKEKEIGKSGLYHIFTSRSAKHLQPQGRQVMVWERPMGWTKGDSTVKRPIQPQKGLVLTESYDYETPDLRYAKEAKSLGYPIFGYDPNPGVEPLFLPYFFRKPRDFAKETIIGSLENSYNYLTANMGKGVFDGVICTSWDDAGLHNQSWMLRFVISAAYSWNASGPAMPEFTASFFKNYYGEPVSDMEKLYYLLNEGSLFYMESLERHVWHDKSIGKTQIPDIPRGDALEYHPFWNSEYADRVAKANEITVKMDEALAICNANLHKPIKNRYDFELMITVVNMVRHTARVYQDLSALENAIAAAHHQRILSHEETYRNLQKAEKILQDHLADRENVLKTLVSTWEKTRLPKGLSLEGKPFFFEQDRTVHFANRAAGMEFLTYDETKLDLEGYLVKLQQYMSFYKNRFLSAK